MFQVRDFCLRNCRVREPGMDREAHVPSEERFGDVSNVLFSNGWVCQPDGTVLVYYASSDTRMHVATSSVERLLDNGTWSAATMSFLAQFSP